MASGDVFVCPSRREGLGSIVMESWAHGCPIVATRSQGPGEVIEDGVTGLLTPVDDADTLAAAINRVLGDAALRRQLAAAGSSHYAVHYSEAVVVQAFADLSRRLVPRRG